MQTKKFLEMMGLVSDDASICWLSFDDFYEGAFKVTFESEIACWTSKPFTPIFSISRMNNLSGSEFKNRRPNTTFAEMNCRINSLVKESIFSGDDRSALHRVLHLILEGRLLKSCREKTKCAGLMVASDELSPYDTHFWSWQKFSYDNEYFPQLIIEE